MKHIPLILALVIPAASAAQNASCNPEGTQSQMNICAYNDFERADALLNVAYKQAMRSAKNRGLDAQLRAAQRAWIPYRDAACEAEAALFAGGSMQPLIQYSCLATLTQERTKHLSFFDDM